MKNLVLSLVLITGFSVPSNAQFLKNLCNKAERTAQNTIEKKVEQKTAEKTEEIIDTTLSSSKKETSESAENASSLEKEEPSATYSFDYEVKMEITSKKEVQVFTYLIPEEGDYFCLQMSNEEAEGSYYSVFDVEKETLFTFMESGGIKMRMGMSFKMDEDEVEDAEGQDDFTVEATGNSKTIDGYKCFEHKVTGPEMTATAWVTTETDLRFPAFNYGSSENEAATQEWMDEVDGWVMEMEMIDTSKKKPTTITLKCLSIEKSDFILNSSDYTSFGG